MLEAGVPVAVVLSDRPCAAPRPGRGAGAAAELVDRREWGGFGADFDREGFTAAVTPTLVAHQVDLVAMAGFGTVLTEPVHGAFADRILNTHPALLPAFPGWHGVHDALAAGVSVTGCTVHLATLEMDAGPILAQESVPVLPGDTAATLHERIKEVERRSTRPPWPGGCRRARPPPDRLDGLPGRRRAASPRRTRRRRRREAVRRGDAYVRALLSVYDKNGLVELAGPVRAGLGAGGQRQHGSRADAGRRSPTSRWRR